VLGKLTGRDRGSNGMFVAQGALVERDDVLEARGLRTAVVGGRGIGKAIARALAAEGCDLGLVARTQWPRGGTPAELASESGRRVVALPADTGADAAAETMAARALAVRGGAEILVNAAATPNTGAAECRDYRRCYRRGWRRPRPLLLLIRIDTGGQRCSGPKGEMAAA